MNMVTVEFISEMEKGVDSVIDGSAEEYISKFNAPSDVVEYLEKLGWEMGESEQNGWQADCWYPVSKGDKHFQVEGSGYYGGVKFYKLEKFED